MPNYYTVPHKLSVYKIDDAWKKFNIINWWQYLNNIQVGDIIYIYSAEPRQRIICKCLVKETNLIKPNIDDREFFADPSEYGNKNKYMTIELLKLYDDSFKKFKYDHIKKVGFTNPQSQCTACAELVKYLEQAEEEVEKFRGLVEEICDKEYDDMVDKLLNKDNTKQEKTDKSYTRTIIIKDLQEIDNIVKHNTKPKKTKGAAKNIDYVKKEISQINVGTAGADAVVEFEKNRLKEKGLNNSFKNVRRVNDDSLGYDVISYNEDGTEKYIEVKTNVSGNGYIDFHITKNELEKLNGKNNFLYYVMGNKKDNEATCIIIDKKILLENQDGCLEPEIYHVKIEPNNK